MATKNTRNSKRALDRFCAFLWLTCLGLGPTIASAQRVEISWPTPNNAWERGRNYENWVQPTVSGEPRSGLWGSVRSNGAQFHEGLDIRALNRDRNGEPTDRVTAAMDGVVRHVSTRAGDSNYGRYIVIEHPGQSPAVHTLYAHLARIEPGIARGVTVKRGQVIGVMGHSSNGNIPKERAHLHFEIGLRMTDQFESWYGWKKFGSPNVQGAWNGMNLMGIDPKEFLDRWRSGRVDTFAQYFARLDCSRAGSRRKDSFAFSRLPFHQWF